MGRGRILACSCGSCTTHMNHTPLQETKVRDDKLTEELCCVEGYQASWGRECRTPRVLEELWTVGGLWEGGRVVM